MHNFDGQSPARLICSHETPIEINSFVGFGLMISLLVFAPEPSFAACRNSGGSSGSNSVGSQVNGSSVTICASALAVVPARTSVVKSKVVVKPNQPLQKHRRFFVALRRHCSPKLWQPISKPKPKVVIAPAAKPKVAAQTKIVNSVLTAPGSTSKSSATADFSPAAVSANVYPSDQLVVGQTASFSSSALQHFKSGTLLNLPTEVRFTPISVDWDFQGEGETQASAGRGSYVNHVFSSAGLFQVQVMATYAVSYRLRGSHRLDRRTRNHIHGRRTPDLRLWRWGRTNRCTCNHSSRKEGAPCVGRLPEAPWFIRL